MPPYRVRELSVLGPEAGDRLDHVSVVRGVIHVCLSHDREDIRETPRCDFPALRLGAVFGGLVDTFDHPLARREGSDRSRLAVAVAGGLAAHQAERVQGGLDRYLVGLA